MAALNAPKIPKELEPALLAERAKGLSFQALADWLQANHGITVRRESMAWFFAGKGRNAPKCSLTRAPPTRDRARILEAIVESEYNIFANASSVLERREATAVLLRVIELERRYPPPDQAKGARRNDRDQALSAILATLQRLEKTQPVVVQAAPDAEPGGSQEPGPQKDT